MIKFDTPFFVGCVNPSATIGSEMVKKKEVRPRFSPFVVKNFLPPYGDKIAVQQ